MNPSSKTSKSNIRFYLDQINLSTYSILMFSRSDSYIKLDSKTLFDNDIFVTDEYFFSYLQKKIKLLLLET